MSTITLRTTCNRDCPDACGLLATVQDGRVTQLKGDPEHPVTRGFICYRTSRFPERQYGAQRLTSPLLRKNGQLVAVSMAEALDYAAEKLMQIRAESGPAAVFHYRSGGSLGLLKMISDRFFEQFGPCTAKTGDICSGAGESAQLQDLGVSDSNDLFDLHNSRFIYLWGKNPFASNIHLIPVLKEARERGARITLIDPVHHKGASLADRVLQPRPGSDLDLILAISRVLLTKGFHPRDLAACDGVAGWRTLVSQRTVEEYAQSAQVAVADIETMAEEFAQGPAAILVGWGMQRRGHGGATVRALDALSAVTGNLFRSGGGCSFYFRRRGAFDSAALTAGEAIAPRLIREPLLGQDILAAKDPPIRAIWITAGNPVCMLPDSATVARAIERTEFTVVVDPFMTDTARRATLVLPVPTLLEDSDLLGAYGHHWLGESQPVVPPPPGVLHEVELFQQLAERVGIGPAMAGSVEDWKRRLLAKATANGVTLERLRQGAVRNPFAQPLRFPEHKVETPSGRVQLLQDRPKESPAPANFPLWLFSNSTAESQASQWAGKGLGANSWIAVHPDAAPPGRKPGDLVTVESPQGSLRVELRLDPEQRRDVAIMPKGGHFDLGQSANALIAAVPTDLGLGAAYLDCRVRLS